MNRRGFVGTALASIGGLISSQKLEANNSLSKRIRVFCLGDDDNPASTEDIIEVQKDVEKHPENFPEVASGKYINYIWEGQSRLPVREFTISCDVPGVAIVRIGNDNRPPEMGDFKDLKEQLDKGFDDPELIIITHHSFGMEWIPTQTEPKVPYILASHVM